MVLTLSATSPSSATDSVRVLETIPSYRTNDVTLPFSARCLRFFHLRPWSRPWSDP